MVLVPRENWGVFKHLWNAEVEQMTTNRRNADNVAF